MAAALSGAAIPPEPESQRHQGDLSPWDQQTVDTMRDIFGILSTVGSIVVDREPTQEEEDAADRKFEAIFDSLSTNQAIALATFLRAAGNHMKSTQRMVTAEIATRALKGDSDAIDHTSREAASAVAGMLKKVFQGGGVDILGVSSDAPMAPPVSGGIVS